jgi:DNA topoisomerase-1
MSADALTLEQALSLLALPRLIGAHPDDGEPVEAGVGRFGPYVKHGKTYANLKDAEDVLSIGMNRAVDLLAAKRAGGARRGQAVAALRALGEHPEGGPVELHGGRYGPYVKWGKVNATLPKDLGPDAVTLEQALALIAAKAPAKKAGRAKPKAEGAAAAKAAAAAAKPGAKKTPEKPTAPKPKSPKPKAEKPKAAKPRVAPRPKRAADADS